MAQIMDGVSLPIEIEGWEDKSWDVWRLLFGDFERGDEDDVRVMLGDVDGSIGSCLGWARERIS